MFNPLLEGFDGLSDQDIENKIFELNKKYWQASRNPSLQQQISVLIEQHKEELRTRVALAKQKQQEQQENGDNSLDNLINIS